MGQTDNHKSNFHLLILGCKSFGLLGFIPGDALPGLNLNSSCLFLGHFPFSFVFCKWNACSIGFRSGDWLGHCHTSCGEPSVFTLVKSSLDCWLWHTYTYLLESVHTVNCDSSLGLILRVDSNRFQMQIAHLKWTLDLLSAPCKWDNEGITHTMEQLSSQLSHYHWSLKKWEAHIETVVIPTPFTWFGRNTLKLKLKVCS